MYVRKEIMEEENLNWDKHLVNEPQLACIATAEMTLLDKINCFFSKIKSHNTQNTFLTQAKRFINTNFELSLLFSLLILPYLLGFCFSYFLFYFYGGMSISDFLAMEQRQLALEMWGMGAYILFIFGATLSFFNQK